MIKEIYQQNFIARKGGGNSLEHFILSLKEMRLNFRESSL